MHVDVVCFDAVKKRHQFVWNTIRETGFIWLENLSDRENVFYSGKCFFRIPRKEMALKTRTGHIYEEYWAS